MFTITTIDLLIADPILSAQLKMLANELLEPFRNIKLSYWVVVENDNENTYVFADNGYDISKKLKCSHTTRNKLLALA